MNKYLEKLAEQSKEAGIIGGFVNSIAKRATPIIGGIKADAAQLPGQLRGVKTAFSQGQGNVFKRPGMMNSLNALGKNRAVRVGAGIVAGGIGASMLMGQNKQAELSEENKTVLRTAGEAAAVGVPVHLAGETLGNYLGRKFGAKAALQSAGGHILGVLGDMAAIKHSLHNKIVNPPSSPATEAPAIA